MFLSFVKTLGCSICEYLLFYKTLTSVLTLTTKQKAYLCSIKSSATMTIIGVYYNYLYFFDQETFHNHDTFNTGKTFTTYFTAYLVTDSYLGTIEYPEYFTFLAGKVHHRVYILLSLICLYMNTYNVYLVFMISELPTLILSTGSFDKNYRSDLWFGISFFATRLLYHMGMVYHFWYISLVPIFGVASTLLHAFWFNGWVKKYL